MNGKKKEKKKRVLKRVGKRQAKKGEREHKKPLTDNAIGIEVNEFNHSEKRKMNERSDGNEMCV